MRESNFDAENSNMSNSGFEYPLTERHEVMDEIHGEMVRDEYRWLEDESDDKVKAWVSAQNEFTREWLSDLSVEEVYEELKQDLDAFSKGLPIMRGDNYFWRERQPGQDQHVLYRSAKLGGEKTLVFNPNELSDDASIALSFFGISKTGRFAVYGLQERGAERSSVYIRNLDSGEDTKFHFGRTFSMCWRRDEEGFYYVVSDYETHGGDVADETHYQQVYYHRLGSNRGEDKSIFNASEHLPKDAWLGMNISDDSRYLAVGASIGYREKHSYIIDTETGKTYKLDIPAEAKTGIRLLDGYIYATTNHDANNKRILRVDMENMELPVDEWEEFIPEQTDSLIMGWGASNSRIVIDYFHNVVSKPALFDRRSGEHLGTLDLPEIANLSSLSVSEDHEEFFYGFSTFFSPSTKYRFNPDKGKSELYWKDERSVDEKRFTARQEWYESKDGTKVPMFIVGPKDGNKNGDNPVVLNGYGGYGISRASGFIGSYKSWLERGGYYISASIRGGGEFGDEWHKGGIRENKQTSFDDFIAAAEYCLDSGLTNREKLIIRGGSNGGLLMGAVMTQRPELFGGVVAQVPILDMYRYHKFLLAYRWTREWGHPDERLEFDWLKKYSPYHRADEKQQYPPLLLTAGINDSRVHPMHAWKMAAKLQNGHPDNLVLLKTDMESGHGTGKGFYKGMHDEAEILSFMMRTAGLL